MKPATFFLAFILIITALLGFTYYTSGATLTNLNSTDIISNFPTTHNTNMANINSELLGLLTPARFTATSTSATSTIQWGLEIYDRHLAVGSTATTTIRGTATSTFSRGINAAIDAGCIAVNGTCLTTSGVTGTGSLNALTYWSSTTGISATSSQPLFIGSLSASSTATSTLSGGLYASQIAAPYLQATSTTPSIFTGGFVSQASSTFSSTLRITGNLTADTLTSGSIVLGGGTSALTASSSLGDNVIADGLTINTAAATTLAGGVTITCTSCITDANVTDVLTIGATGSVNSTALTDGGTIGFEWVDAEVAAVLTISGGTVNNSTIGATTPSTGAFTTLSATGLTSLFGNLTATSTIDFSGGVFRGVASSTLTTTASGNIGVDTTQGQLRYGDGVTSHVVVATTSPVFAVSSTTLAALGAYGEGAGTSSFKLAGIWSAHTINELFCSVMGTSTSIGASVRFGTGAASTSFAFGNTAGTLTVLSSNNSFSRYQNIFVEVGSAVNSPDLVTCSANRTYNSD